MKKKYVYLVLGSLPIIALDQITKEWIQLKFHLFESLTIISKFLYITYIHNRGGAFGLFSNMGEGFLNTFFVIVPLLAVAFILYLYHNAETNQKLYKLSLILIFSGAIGNLIDRLRFNYVRDFIDVDLTWVPFYKQHWPAFNVADSSICIGVTLLIIYSFFFEHKHKRGV
ncbi:MAG: signal peptidase II [Deltaproteobacteria bacterium]|nr:signal peptidase II [Deltaproteobacteria bacterium]